VDNVRFLSKKNPNEAEEGNEIAPHMHASAEAWDPMRPDSMLLEKFFKASFVGGRAPVYEEAVETSRPKAFVQNDGVACGASNVQTSNSAEHFWTTIGLHNREFIAVQIPT
jgi:hypothetical protein